MSQKNKTITIIFILSLLNFFIACKQIDHHEEHNRVNKKNKTHENHPGQTHSHEHDTADKKSSPDDDHVDKAHDHEKHTENPDDDDDHQDDQLKTSLKKAIVKSDEHNGIILSSVSEKFLEIKTKKSQDFYRKGILYRVPIGSLIFYEERVSIFYKRNGWFNSTDIYLIHKNAKEALIRSSELKKNDKIVIHGAALLRLAYLDAFGATGHGHVH